MLFAAAHGGEGANGGKGGGGGGGGIGKGCSCIPSGDFYWGAGGGGGQGGGPGTGGAGGGASVGIWLVGVKATIEDNTISAGHGGAGAAGGSGGAGLSGGVGGQQTAGEHNPFGYCHGTGGGHGGNGGRGGQGGQGGGGGGGPSLGIFVGPGIAPVIQRNVVTAGPGGAGGDNGAGTSSGGQGGFSYCVYDADASDTAVPLLVGNELTPGLAGTNGSGVAEIGAGATNF